MSDIIEELDRWLRAGHFTSQQDEYRVVERARDEITALRTVNVAVKVHHAWSERIDQARTQALEEAAQVIELQNWETGPTACAAMIRAMKGEPAD